MLKIYGNTFFEPGSESFFVSAFFFAIALLLIFALLALRRQIFKVRAFVVCGILFHIPAFYFLLRCSSNNFGKGILPNAGSLALSFAGLFWAVAMMCFLRSVKELIRKQ